MEYSLKNIPICNKRAYKIKIYDKASKFINRMRWAAYWFDNPSDDGKGKDVYPNYRFPCRNAAAANTLLTPFENELYDLINSISFRPVRNKFQSKLIKDKKSIMDSKNIIAFADKTNNFYELEPDRYKKLLLENITKDYKKADNKTIEEINDEAQQIIDDMKISGKIPKLDAAEPFVTIKDHKEEFPKTVKFRLINPSKTHIAKVSKSILDRVNSAIRTKTKFVQWKNSRAVIDWFNMIAGKEKKCFVSFDIVEFYPSIKHHHVVSALKFAEQFCSIDDTDINIILHACKTVLVHDERTWVKKGDSGLFDIPMGSFHGAEICDLIGLHLLSAISPIFNSCEYGLYRDDGLAIIDSCSPSAMERLSKQLRSKIKEFGFKITIDAGRRAVNFLDVTLDLIKNTYYPYRKPNSSIQYINNRSNHPYHIKKALPGMIERRLRSLSKNAEVFNKTKAPYDDALIKSGYPIRTLNYEEPSTGVRKRKRNRRQCIFFNPPFCESVATNVGKQFLKLVDKHFGKHHVYHRIFNRTTIKVSYSCMPNMRSIITSHNKRILTGNNNYTAACNCRNGICPVNGRCRTKGVIYEAKVTTEKETVLYVGSTGDEFKTRYYGHTASFKDEKSETRLS